MPSAPPPKKRPCIGKPWWHVPHAQPHKNKVNKNPAFTSVDSFCRTKSRIITWHSFCTSSWLAVFANQLLAAVFVDWRYLRALLIAGDNTASGPPSVAYHNNSATSKTESVLFKGGVPDKPQRCVAPKDFITSRTAVFQDSDSWNSSSTIPLVVEPTRHMRKICSSNWGSFPQVSMKNMWKTTKKSLKAPPRYGATKWPPRELGRQRARLPNDMLSHAKA